MSKERMNARAIADLPAFSSLQGRGHDTANLVDDLVESLTRSSTQAIRSINRGRIEALGRGIATELVRHLDHTDCLTRWEVVNLLGEFAHPATVERVVRFALQEDEVHARWRAFWAVSCFDQSASIPLLLSALDEGDPTTRWRAALMLSMLDCPQAEPVLLEGLDSPDAWIQWESLNAIRSVGLAGAEDAVSCFLAPGSLRDHRQEAVLALGAIGSERALAIVVRSLDDSDPQVRWRASMSLARSEDPRWCPALRRRLAQETDSEVRTQLRHDIDFLESTSCGRKQP